MQRLKTAKNRLAAARAFQENASYTQNRGLSSHGNLGASSSGGIRSSYDGRSSYDPYGGVQESSDRSPLLPRPKTALSRYTIMQNAQDAATSVLSLTKVILLSNYVNILLVFVPLGVASHFAGWGATATFVLNFLAIIPLASLLSYATEELSIHVGQTIGGLLNATFGNAVELIVSIIALTKGELRIVQSSMLGSILSNILLVLGCCFIAGGIKRKMPAFNTTIAQTMCGLMAVATSSLLIPAAFHLATPATGRSDEDIVILSHATSVILLILYFLFLLFQLKTHVSIYAEAEESDDEAFLSPYSASAVLVVVTLLVSLCAEYLVGSIDTMVESSGISKTFIGLILIPIVGNAAEHVTAVMVSYKGKMDLAVGVAIGSSMQISLFVTPFLVILGWTIGQPLTLYFKTFETVIMFTSVLIVNYLIMDGETHYLEGAQLIGVYVIIAVAFFLYPDNEGV